MQKKKKGIQYKHWNYCWNNKVRSHVASGDNLGDQTTTETTLTAKLFLKTTNVQLTSIVRPVGSTRVCQNLFLHLLLLESD